MKSTQAGEQLKVRLQTQVHEWIKAQAKEQDRSMNWLVNKFFGTGQRGPGGPGGPACQDGLKKGNAPEVAATGASSVQTQPLTEGFNMSNSTQVAAGRAITVPPFHGADLYVVENNGQPYTPMKPIVAAMGLDWGASSARWRPTRSRWGIVNLTIPSAGGEQAVTCLPVRKTAAWLTTIEPEQGQEPPSPRPRHSVPERVR